MREKKGAVRGKEEVDRIRVFVRIRPLNDEELRRGETVGFETITERNEIVFSDGKEKRFNFDGIFTGSVSNKRVFKEIGKPLVDAAFRGYNGTLMAYGQTGTGKTYTQMSHGGVCMLSVQKLFKRIQNDGQHDYKVYLSYLQIYQEKIFDLINPDHRLEMVLREDPKKGVYVENLTEYVVRSAEEVMSLIRSGKKRLIFAETRMNRLSSSGEDTGRQAPYRARSHSVCQITVERSIARESVQKSVSTVTNSSTTAAQPRRRHSSHDNSDAISSKIPMPKFGITRAQAIPDHVTNASKIPAPLRRGSHDEQRNFHSFIPHQASTPNLRTPTDCLRTPSNFRFSSVSSLPELPSAIKPPNRLSFHELSRSLSGSMESDMMSLDSDMLGSEAESVESLKSPVGISGIFEDESDIFDEEEDDDEAFMQSIKIRDDVVTRGRINICDLAGSERVKRAQVDGERLSELQHINLSLLELGNTIHALSEGNRTHIPYRNSTLTRLLQDSLGGNCKTVFVLCVSPTRMDLSETRCTLEFGSRALKIKNTTYVNMEVDFVKLAADLRKKLEAQDLEIQSQKECYEKQMQELQNNQLAKLAEKESLLEHEKDEAREETQKLKAENENLKKRLEEESNRKSLLEQENLEFLEKSLREEQEKSEKLNEHQREIERLKQELKEEKRKSVLLEERTKVDLENLLEAERQEAMRRQLMERKMFEAELEEERQRGLVEQKRQTERVYRDASCQSPTEDMIDIGLDQPVIPEYASTETLYNVLLAEIMSLQLLYQMQDIADVCNGVLPRSTDSGWADYDDDLLENVGMNLLEKGGIILDTLRHNGDVTSHMTSTDSLRDVFVFPFPSSPKISCSTEERSNPSILRISRDLINEFGRKETILEQLHNASSSTMGSKISSEYSFDENNKNVESVTSSSMSSYCDQEPLSPRAKRQPSDSGCSTQHSETDSPVEQRPKLPKSFSSKGLGSNVCVPLAEEDDEDLFNDMEDVEQEQNMEILKDRVSKLDLELLRLKNELDRETVNFFSAVFLVDLSSYVEEDSPRVMRYLFDCVRDKLSAEIANKSDTNKLANDLELPLSVLEQAVNLLLVNKTVLSCILVLQNRARINERQRDDTLPSIDLSSTLEPKEDLKIDQEVQTEEPSRSFKQHKRRGLLSFASKRRHSNQDAGTCTEPASPVHHRECQTSDDWTISSSPILTGNQASGTTPISQEDPWSKRLQEALTSNDTFFSENLSRDPDGASIVDTPSAGASVEEHLPIENQKGEDQIPSEDEADENSKQKKKKMNLLSCLGPRAKISFRKKKNPKAPGEKPDKLSKKK